MLNYFFLTLTHFSSNGSINPGLGGGVTLDFRHIPAVDSDKCRGNPLWIVLDMCFGECPSSFSLLWKLLKFCLTSRVLSIKHLSKRRGLVHRSSVNIHSSQTRDTRQWQPGEKLDKTDEKERKPTHGISLLGGVAGDAAGKLFCGKRQENLFSVRPWGAEDNRFHNTERKP